MDEEMHDMHIFVFGCQDLRGICTRVIVQSRNISDICFGI